MLNYILFYWYLCFSRKPGVSPLNQVLQRKSWYDQSGLSLLNRSLRWCTRFYIRYTSFFMKTESTYYPKWFTVREKYWYCDESHMLPREGSALWAVCMWIKQHFSRLMTKTNKLACAPSEDSDQPGHPPSLIRVFAVRMKKSCVLSYPMSAQRRLWSVSANAQADLSLCWAHRSFCWFCHEAAHLLLLLCSWCKRVQRNGSNTPLSFCFIHLKLAMEFHPE